MADSADPRRPLMLTAGIAGAGMLFSSQRVGRATAAENSKKRGEENEVGAVEEDGFEDAVKQMTQIEQTLGFADLAQFTAPPPPKV